MAWSTPRTFVAAAVLTAAQLNENRDNWNAQFPLGTPAWTSYTPTLTQSATITKTVTYAKYTRIGNWVLAEALLAMTSSGTANNAVVVGLPVAANASVPGGQAIGTGKLETAAYFPGIAVLNTTTTVVFVDATASTTAGLFLGQTGTAASGAFVSGNKVTMEVKYEV